MSLRRFPTFSWKSICSIGAAMMLFAAAAQGAQSPQNQPSRQAKEQDNVLRIESELVQIDLTVTDKQSNLIRDLRREDFELFEDGKKQTLTHFAIGTAKQPARWLTAEKRQPLASSQPFAASASGKTVETNNRHIVLAVDDYHLSPSNLTYVKHTLNKFINEQMAGGDQAAIVTTSGNTGLFQQFTSERPVLERAVSRLSVQEKKLENSFDIPRITEHQAELIEYGDRGAMELAINDIMRFEAQDYPNGPPSREILEYRVRTKARLVLAMNGHYLQATLTTLENVIRNLRPLAGRKIMVLLSDGFFLSGTGLYSKLFDLRRITDAATRAGVVIYSIDARGLVTVTPGGDASERVEFAPSTTDVQLRLQMSAINAQRDGLYALAAETGGTLFYNSNDLSLGLQRVLDANETYYVMAYQPSESRRDGRFHKIEVRVAGRPELKVRTRNGYYAPDDKAEKDARKAEEKRQEKLKTLPPEKLAQELQVEKEKQLAVGIGSLFPLRDIPIELAVDFVDLATFSGAILNTHINAARLSFEDAKGRQQSVVEIAGYFFDERGKSVASFNERIDLNIKSDTMESLLRQGFNYRRLVELKPGFYQARVAVREEKSGRLGSVTAWVEIADVKTQKLTLSGIMLSEAGKGGLQDLADNTAANPSGSYTPRPSSASRRFKSGGDVDLLLFVYNAKSEQNTVDLAIQTQIFSGSKQVFATPLMKIAVAQDSELQRIPFAARLPLKALSPGQYELRLMVIDRLTKVTAHRQVNFTVE